MSTVQQRTLLYARLEEVLGPEPAGILMQELAPQDGVATKADVADAQTRLETQIDGATTQLDVRMDGLDARMDRLEGHMDRLDDRLHDLHGALREQTRHFILASTGTMVALTGVAFGAAALI
ncbi:MAG: hypothetical protein QNL12_07025 [Acidimicrobiia bacterium]|nr:hypothetical protein [Acidimicrobiia bacterium]MDX2467047.1 hypothetical protein [Acidimicrobiia bacterium]